MNIDIYVCAHPTERSKDDQRTADWYICIYI